MNSDSAVRMPPLTDQHLSLHLVHSRNWNKGKSRTKPAAATPNEAQSARHIRESGENPTPSGAAGRLLAPIVRLGQTFLRWMHLL